MSVLKSGLEMQSVNHIGIHASKIKTNSRLSKPVKVVQYRDGKESFKKEIGTGLNGKISRVRVTKILNSVYITAILSDRRKHRPSC